MGCEMADRLEHELLAEEMRHKQFVVARTKKLADVQKCKKGFARKPGKNEAATPPTNAAVDAAALVGTTVGQTLADGADDSRGQASG